MILNEVVDSDLLQDDALENDSVTGDALAPNKNLGLGDAAGVGGEAKAITLFRSGEVIKRSGVSRQILYQYTAMGLVEEAQRTENGHRLYGQDIFDRLRLIRELNNSGYALKDIKEIFFSKGA